MNDSDRACVLAALIVLREKGPGLSRPYADTLHGSRFSNMKELRIQSRGDPIRAFFAFDLNRRGILLCAGNKVGNEKRFYREMIPLADREFTHWLNMLNNKE
nr:type II toxin-antitoxin system RelE/ParE family toxin [Erwinia mallotivora]